MLLCLNFSLLTTFEYSNFLIGKHRTLNVTFNLKLLSVLQCDVVIVVCASTR